MLALLRDAEHLNFERSQKEHATDESTEKLLFTEGLNNRKSSLVKNPQPMAFDAQTAKRGTHSSPKGANHR